MSRYAIPVTVLAILLGAGALHGLWSGRWGEPVDAEAIRARLQLMPENFGDWVGVADGTSTEATVPEVFGPSLVRRYANRLNGQAVTVYLTAGETGPVLVNHPPVHCYEGVGYTLAADPVRYTVATQASSPSAEFWVADFRKDNAPLPTALRVFWSWSGSGDWKVPENPRLVFARYRTLYKLYVIRTLAKGDGPVEKDPALEFIQAFVPEVAKTVFGKS